MRAKRRRADWRRCRCCASTAWCRLPEARPVLADVKAVGEGYPLRGAIVFARARVLRTVCLRSGVPRRGEAWSDDAPRCAPRSAPRLAPCGRGGDAHGYGHRAAGSRSSRRPARARSPAAHEYRRCAGDQPAAAGKSRLVSPARRGQRDRRLSRLGSAAPRTRRAAGVDPRPAARDPANARARRPFSRSRLARGGDPRGGGGGAGGGALPAPPSRRGGDDALLRRAAAANPGIVRHPVRRARPMRKRGRDSGCAWRAAVARHTARRGDSRRPAATRMAAGGRVDGHGALPAVRVCAAAADGAVAGAAVARASSRPGHAARRRPSRLQHRCRPRSPRWSPGRRRICELARS